MQSNQFYSQKKVLFLLEINCTVGTLKAYFDSSAYQNLLKYNYE